MPVLSLRVDEDSLEYFSRYCDLNGLTRMEGFKHMVDVFKCSQEKQSFGETTVTESSSPKLWYNGEKKDIISHLCKCFANYGGELRKEGRCFLANEEFVIYVLYRELLKDESKVVKVSGSCVKQLEKLAFMSGKKALIAVLAKPAGMLPFYGILPLDSVTPVVVEKGSRNARYAFFRRKNGDSLKDKISEEDAIFIHVRNASDKRALQEAYETGEPRQDWYKAFYAELSTENL